MTFFTPPFLPSPLLSWKVTMCSRPALCRRSLPCLLGGGSAAFSLQALGLFLQTSRRWRKASRLAVPTLIRCVRSCPQLLRSRAVPERRRGEGRGGGGGGPGRLQPVQRGHRHRRGGSLQTQRPAGKSAGLQTRRLQKPSPHPRLFCHVFPLQPGCKYQIQLRAEGNDHIERALPQQRWVEVRRTRAPTRNQEPMASF